MTWDESAHGFMVAISTSGGNRLWFMPMYSSGAWSEWRFFETHLWAPHGTTNLWRGTWITGWTLLVPFQLDGKPHLLLYNNGTGDVAIDRIDDFEHDAPNMQSVTASRWMEDRPGMTSPVVFTTDDSGNVYFIEYARRDTAGWVLDWKSFYHETIPY